MSHLFRLSRIRAPRGTLTAMVLLTAVFLVFGLALSAAEPTAVAAAPRPFTITLMTLASWLLGF
jgi:hypothetical protein